MIKYRSTKKHTIDSLFPMILFLVMTVFALFVIILAANIYKNSSENSYRNHQSRIALSYISEKIHQNTDTFLNAMYVGTASRRPPARWCLRSMRLRPLKVMKLARMRIIVELLMRMVTSFILALSRVLEKT